MYVCLALYVSFSIRIVVSKKRVVFWSADVDLLEYPSTLNVCTCISVFLFYDWYASPYRHMANIYDQWKLTLAWPTISSTKILRWVRTALDAKMPIENISIGLRFVLLRYLISNKVMRFLNGIGFFSETDISVYCGWWKPYTTLLRKLQRFYLRSPSVRYWHQTTCAFLTESRMNAIFINVM